MSVELSDISKTRVGLPSDGLIWPIETAAGALLKIDVSPLLLRGLLGILWQSAESEAIFADLEGLVTPGLRCLGIEAVVLPLTDAMRTFAELRQPWDVPVYAFDGEPFQEEDDLPETSEEAEASAPGWLATRDRQRTQVRSGLVREVTADRIAWQAPSGEMRSAGGEEFGRLFTRAVRLQPGLARATRRVGRAAAVDQGVVFALAYPDRFLTASEADAGRRADAALFLAEAAGKQRDPISLRWRQAADFLAAGDIESALDRLYDAMLRSLGLPEPVYRALAWPADAPLTSVQRRELVYLARAGNRDLKALAAHRLASETGSADVRSTLEQLTWSPDALVRAAAAAALRA